MPVCVYSREMEARLTPRLLQGTREDRTITMPRNDSQTALPKPPQALVRTWRLERTPAMGRLTQSTPQKMECVVADSGQVRISVQLANTTTPALPVAMEIRSAITEGKLAATASEDSSVYHVHLQTSLREIDAVFCFIGIQINISWLCQLLNKASSLFQPPPGTMRVQGNRLEYKIAGQSPPSYSIRLQREILNAGRADSRRGVFGSG
jgi:hypothetical protein